MSKSVCEVGVERMRGRERGDGVKEVIRVDYVGFCRFL